jgi:hypothetical protein
MVREKPVALLRAVMLTPASGCEPARASPIKLPEETCA